MYRYQFTSTIEDLLDAEAARRATHSWRQTVRWILTGAGVFALLAGMSVFEFAQPRVVPFFWTVAGACVAYIAGLRPYLEQRRQRNNIAKIQDVAIEFGDTGMQLQIGEVGYTRRRWQDLTGYQASDKGILFYFMDGVVNWIPDRAFANKTERQNLIDFLESRIGRSDLIPQ